MLYYLTTVLYVLVCLVLILVILLQQGKGGDIAAAFGGSSSQTAFGARAGATVLTRATAVLGTLFMLCAFGLALLSRAGTGGGSVVGDVAAPNAPQQSAPALPGGDLPATPPAATPGAPGGGTTPTPPPTPPVEQGKGKEAGKGKGGGF